MTGATCSNFRDLISLRIDDELRAADAAHLDAHLLACPSCHDYQEDAYALRRSLRLRAVEAAPSTSVAPTDAADIVGSLRGVSALRWALFVIGGTLFLVNFSSLLSSDPGVASHLSRHDGVFGSALGIGMLAVAAKPHRAIGLVPLTSALTGLMAIVAIADLLSGNANLLAEAVHLLEFGGLICLWFVSGGPSRVPAHLARVTRRLPLAG